jgi:protein-tyrosine sulfotransferase
VDDNKKTWPTFLVGCHRSGTTLVRYILDTHPNIACPPETKFLSGLYELQGHPHWQPGLGSLRLTRREIAVEIGVFARRLLDSYATKHNKRRWVDKTPNYYKILPFINEMFGGKVLFLFSVRHPLDNVMSLNEFFKYPTQSTLDSDIGEVIRHHGVGLHAWARYWNEVYESISIFASECCDRAKIFRYEDLVRSPFDTTADILHFMNEEFDPAIVDNALRTKHDMGFQDLKILSTEIIHSDSIDRWRRWNQQTISTVWTIVDELGKRFGYSTD